MKRDVPIKTSHLFSVLDTKLIELLRSLSDEDWQLPTIARLWTVKDIAAHLLDGNIRALSIARDGYSGVQPISIASYQDLLDYLNRLNADWVHAMKRMSPKVLTDLLESTGKEFSAYMVAADPFAPAIFPVSWAGEEQSANWFHIAREYTEKWLHQQQIRDAVNRHGIITQELFYPFINTMMQGLPHTYRNTEAATGTCIEITVTTSAGGNWFLEKNEHGWQLNKEQKSEPVSIVIISPETAWKLFSKGITADTALQQTTIEGNKEMGKIALTMIAVMA